MLDLENQIARLELRAEQMSIHLQSLGRNAPEAARTRFELDAMMRELVELKAERERRRALVEAEEAPRSHTGVSYSQPAIVIIGDPAGP